MHCPACDTEAPATDRFCETCGSLLVAERGVRNALPGCPGACPTCGAGPTEMDAQGFCAVCGIRRHAPARDHLEITLSPQLAGVTDRGLHHAHNEDALALAQVPERAASVLVVCDGVSSAYAADLASQAAAEAARRVLTVALQSHDSMSEATMHTAVTAALQAVQALPATPTATSDPPSTTLVAAVMCEGLATLAWVGDSRAYWIDRAGIRLLTHDHSWLNEVMATGRLSLEEALRLPHAHALTRWLGADAEGQHGASVVQMVLPESGVLLLCTDGLWNYTPEPSQLATLVREATANAPDMVTVARRLVTFACACGGRDNVTVALLSLPARQCSPAL